MKDDGDWIELEYTHLRDEILSLGQAKLGTVRFYLPAAATVYAVPYVLKHTNDAFLWSLCAAVAGLLVLTMTQTLCVSSDGIRRIGVYIREVLEPRTNSGLRWENAVNHFDRARRFSLGQSFTISASAVIANVVAATGSALVFLPSGPAQIWPVAAAIATACPALPGLWQLLRPNVQRQKRLKQILPLVESMSRQKRDDSTTAAVTNAIGPAAG